MGQSIDEILVLMQGAIFELLSAVLSVDELFTNNGIARMLKKLLTSKGDYWIKQWLSSIASLFKMGTSVKGKNWLPEGANSYL